MASDFPTPGGRLAVPDTISDTELAARLLPRRYAVLLSAAAALVEFLRQRGTFRIRKVVCKKRLRHWATVCFFTPGFIASLILSSATGTEKNGVQL